MANRHRYRGYTIWFEPPPIPDRRNDWRFVHDNYDGAPDAFDPRCGTAESLEAAIVEIDMVEEELLVREMIG